MDSEKYLEKFLIREVERLGGWCRKLHWIAFTGAPDRIVLMPGARIYFVELKTTGKPLQPRQRYVKSILCKMGFYVDVIDTKTGVEYFIKMLKQDQNVNA